MSDLPNCPECGGAMTEDEDVVTSEKIASTVGVNTCHICIYDCNVETWQQFCRIYSSGKIAERHGLSGDRLDRVIRDGLPVGNKLLLEVYWKQGIFEMPCDNCGSRCIGWSLIYGRLEGMDSHIGEKILHSCDDCKPKFHEAVTKATESDNINE